MQTIHLKSQYVIQNTIEKIGLLSGAGFSQMEQYLNFHTKILTQLIGTDKGTGYLILLFLRKVRSHEILNKFRIETMIKKGNIDNNRILIYGFLQLKYFVL